MSPQVWFITGASSGLGRAMVECVLSKGDIAIATLRKPSALADLSAKYDSSKLLVLKLDVTIPSDITTAFTKAQEAFGRIDVVYNNAGYSILSEIEGTPDDVARAMFEVNFWGSTNIAREAIRFFRDVNKPCGGRLIQASSGAGVSTIPCVGYYSASKHALEGISEALSKEIVPTWNIKITIIELGSFHTRALGPESLVIIPPHPAYTESAAATIRTMLTDPFDASNAQKGVREIYNIANDPNVPLHVALGLDSIGLMNAQIEALKADVEKVGKFSVDLK